jgi:sugar lactone lactonase YvrE
VSSRVEVGGGFAVVTGWEQLPDGMAHRDVADVAVGADNRVYLITRYDAQVLVYEMDGTFVRSWGNEVFSPRPHAITVGPDDTVYVVDELRHAVTAFDTKGSPLFDLGPVGAPSDTGADPEIPDIFDRIATIRRGSGPYNRPTKVAVAPDGTVLVADGYANSRIHRFSAHGELLRSWGEPGGGPGQFHLPHSVAVAPDGTVFVADRENDRIQVFDLDGRYVTEWLDVHRPASLAIHGDRLFVGQLPQRAGYRSWRNGTITEPRHARVGVFDLRGNEQASLGGPDPRVTGGFTAPHGIAVDSTGDLYIAEVSYSDGGRHGHYPEDIHTFVKLASS